MNEPEDTRARKCLKAFCSFLGIRHSDGAYLSLALDSRVFGLKELFKVSLVASCCALQSLSKSRGELSTACFSRDAQKNRRTQAFDFT